MSIAAENKSMSYYERWQLMTRGNILTSEKPEVEEYEYLNLENREVSEWTEQQVEIEQQNKQ